MEKIVQKFNSFEEAEAADRAYYQSLSPDERMQILFEIIYRANNETYPRLERVYRVIERKPR